MTSGYVWRLKNSLALELPEPGSSGSADGLNRIVPLVWWWVPSTWTSGNDGILLCPLISGKILDLFKSVSQVPASHQSYFRISGCFRLICLTPSAALERSLYQFPPFAQRWLESW